MTDNLPKPELTFGEVTAENLDDGFLQQILALSKSVFEPDTPPEGLPPNQQVPAWQKQILLPGARIFYVTDSGKQPVGFFFVIPRTHQEIGSERLHIWIACVTPASRGLGIFPSLTEKAKAHARSLGYSEITVCTFPKRFTKMYRILNQNGWEEVCWLQKDVKVLMKLQI